MQFHPTFSDVKIKKIHLLQGPMIFQMPFLKGLFIISFYVVQGQSNYLKYIATLFTIFTSNFIQWLY